MENSNIVPFKQESSGCIHCAAWLPLSELILITTDVDPYVQDFDDEGNEVDTRHACKKCYRKHYGEPAHEQTNSEEKL